MDAREYVDQVGHNYCMKQTKIPELERNRFLRDNLTMVRVLGRMVEDPTQQEWQERCFEEKR